MTVAHQAPLPMGFFRQEYWSGLPFPSPGDLPTQGENPCLLCLLNFRQILYPLSHLGSPLWSSEEVDMESEPFSYFVLWNEIYPAIIVGKKCHNHQRFWASKCEWALSKGNTMLVIQQMPPPCMVIAGAWGCKKQPSSTLGTPCSEQRLKDVNNQQTGFGPRWLRCILKEWIQWAQRSTSSHT